MPDQRAHRGPNPKDAEAFAPEMVPRLREACADLSWLLSHGYAGKSAAILVGDRYALTERQRIAVRRCACSDEQLRDRRHRQVILSSTGGELAGTLLEIDGYNVLTTVEAALAEAIIIEGRDGCYRDMASMHGNFKRVAETPRAITLIGCTLARCATGTAVWYLDAPVSNSGRLKQLLVEIATTENWDWRVELVPDPDRILAVPPEDRGAILSSGQTGSQSTSNAPSTSAIASADSAILDRAPRWFSLAREVVREHGLTAPLISLVARQD